MGNQFHRPEGAPGEPVEHPGSLLHHLPDGLTSRPLTLGDAYAVYSVIHADQTVNVPGGAIIEPEDIVADWSRPSFSVEDQALGVFADDALVAYGEYSGANRSWVSVHPDHEGHGLGTALARWVAAVARASGAASVGQPVPEGSPADRLLAALGYGVRWTSWVLALPPGASVPDRPLPADHEIRPVEPHEYRAVHAVIDDAFVEWSNRDPEPYDDFLASIINRPGHQPWMLRAVFDQDRPVAATVVGVSNDGEAWLERLATRADCRNRGLAQALVADSFRVGRSNGAVRFGLSTDSRTSALNLYLRVGMTVTDTWINRGISLR